MFLYFGPLGGTKAYLDLQLQFAWGNQTYLDLSLEQVAKNVRALLERPLL